MSNPNKIHFIYLIPSDKTNTTEAALRQAALHMQAWCRWQMANGKTFTPVFGTYQTAHTDIWYSSHTDDPNTPYAEWFWANAQTDARDYAGARFYMTNDSWVIYLDAFCDEEHGQHAGGASVNGSGLCVLHAKDCAAIRGQDPEWTLCRGIGGGLHEALHTLGLPHPAPPPDPDWTMGIMGIGYMNYPDAILTDEDKWTLDHHRFFAVEPASSTRPSVCPFGSVTPPPPVPPRPRPRPRPRPLPPHR